MKEFTSTYLLFTLCLNMLNAQQCYEAPSIEFEGTNVAWSYQVEDPLIDTSHCAGTVFDYQRSNLWVKPLEYEDKYIAIFGNGKNGTIINAFNKETGKLFWQKSINYLNTDGNRGFSCPHVKKIGNNSIELLGYRNYSNLVSIAGGASSRAGFLNRRILSIIDGEESFYQDIPTTNLLYQYGLENGYPSNINSEFYYRLDCYATTTDSIGIVCNNLYTDKKTLLRFLPSTYPNLYPGTPDISELTDDAEELYFYHTDSSGYKVVYNGYYYSKTIENSLTIVLIQYYGDSKNYTSMIKVDQWGNQVGTEKDISTIVNGNGDFAWGFEIDQYDDKLRIHLNNVNGYVHRGYVDIDFDGNLIRDRKILEIDGMIPRLHKTLDIMDSEDVLHVFRPLENNDLFIYREDVSGNYLKIGELLNPNDNFYVFEPEYLSQTSDGDLFIGLITLIDSDFSDFDSGGWGALLKIEAEELGLSVGVSEDQAYDKSINIYPNPTTSNCFVSTDNDNYPIVVSLYSMTGSKVFEETLSSSEDMLNIQSLGGGIYVANILNAKKELILNKKIIKI